MKGLRNKVWGIEFEGEKKNLIYLETLESELCLILRARFSSGSERHMTIYIFSKSPNYPSLAHTNFNAFLRTKPDHLIYISKKLWHRVCLASHLKYKTIYFKHYIYFHTLFHLHIYQKYPNNITQTTLPNTPLIFFFFYMDFKRVFGYRLLLKIKNFLLKTL